MSAAGHQTDAHFPLRQNGQFPACEAHVARKSDLTSVSGRPAPDQGDRHEGRSSQAHQDVRPRLETGRPLRQAGQILELGEEVGVIQKVAFDSTFKDHDLHMLVSFELRHDLLELHDELRPHQIQWWVVEYDAAIARQLPGQPYLRIFCG